MTIPFIMKDFLKQFIPAPLLKVYHYFLSYLAAVIYGFPSEKLIVIGVTGTNGKSTVVNLIGAILEEAGFKVALTSTINFKLAAQENLNSLKMTMPGRFFLQRFLRQAVGNGCQYAVVECSSEGVLQYRHTNIHYDVLVFTNLAPEHIERHGGFENYKSAKLDYFVLLEKLPPKVIRGKTISKAIVVNAESKYAEEFLNFKVDQKFAFSFSAKAVKNLPGAQIISPERIDLSPAATTFFLHHAKFTTPLLGLFNVENALAAVACALSLGVSLETSQKALAHLKQIPGRLEFIREGQNFDILIDYAPEPNSLSALYGILDSWPHGRLIHILGSAGGGRDKSRRQVLGRMAGATADIVIVANEDPYDEDPQAIIDQVGAGAVASGKILGKDLFTFLDRREAIAFALKEAKPKDLILLTGKGAEQAIMVAHGRKVPWDERVVVREELGKVLRSKN
ncbi:UDP-N-acetylmuramyl-tripeptide synthetase [bacterium]|nr:MAG: UDP-N-acetylmuramyl-tripeptide synthetase [bacterium]